MPVNQFMRPSLYAPSGAGFGMNIGQMLAAGGQQVMGDVEENRQMSRRKFANDILSQQLLQAQQELKNREEGYHFGQEQQYYNSLQTPEGQAMWRAYQERMGLPPVRLTNPNQIHDWSGVAGMANAQDEHTQAVAAHILANSFSQPGVPDKPEVLWARHALGIATPTSGAPQEASKSATPPPAAPRSAMGVFMNRFVPTALGTAAGTAAFSMVPNPWLKLPAAIGAGALANKGGEMLMGQLTPEESSAHPTAEAAGNIGGTMAGLIRPGAKYVGSHAPAAGEKGMFKNIRALFKRGAPTGSAEPNTGSRGEAAVRMPGLRGEASMETPSEYRELQQRQLPVKFGSGPPATQQPASGGLVEMPQGIDYNVGGGGASSGQAMKMFIAKFRAQYGRLPTIEQIQDYVQGKPIRGFKPTALPPGYPATPNPSAQEWQLGMPAR